MNSPLSVKSASRLVLSRRIRPTPFEARVFDNGAGAFTVYNHMPLASCYASLEEDYVHLRNHVQLWDVSCERQVEVRGADALRLVELLTPRDISKCQVGQCMYAPLVDENGGIVNDPIVLRLAAERFWISIADSGVLLWLKGIAFGRGYEVEIFEPDVSPLGVQGPKSDALMAELFGAGIKDLRRFWFKRVALVGTRFIVARSGWSGQSGFELYLEDSACGLALWDAVWEAGQKYHIRAGCPNLIDRIEAGLLSYGSDMTLANNPYEVGFERFMDEDKAAEYMARAALDRVRAQGPEKQLVYLVVAGEPLVSPRATWDVMTAAGEVVGMVTSLAYSPTFNANLGFALVDAAISRRGATLRVEVGEAVPRSAEMRNRQWQ